MPEFGFLKRIPFKKKKPGNERTSNASADLVDIPSSISQSTDLRDPLNATSEALKKVLETAGTMDPLGEEWIIPLRRLLFHHDTLESQNEKLEEDVQIDQTPPPPEPNVIYLLEAYAKELNKIYRLLCGVKTSSLSLGSSNKTIAKTIRDMDTIFEQYTDALHNFAAESIVRIKPPQPHSAHGSLVNAPHILRKVPTVYGVQHVPCLVGTREKTLAAITEWADEKADAQPIFLLLDVAGSGKSTVAKHMANQWTRDKRLLARFFFSRDTLTTMSTDSFCSTVSNSFIAQDLNFETPIKAFKKRPDFALLSFEELFNGLIINPLEELNQEAILIIDALDECDNERGSRNELLSVLRNQRTSRPLLRIFATGRPELDIKQWAHHSGIRYASFFQLEGGDKDVEVYIKHRLQHFSNIQDRLYHVIKHADGVFIWARIACDLIDTSADPDGLLEELGKEVSLDFLYKVALGQSIPKDERSQQAFTVVFQMILAAREPLSVAELEKLSPKSGIVEGVVSRLGALLLYKDRYDPIRLLHATFREFLTSRAKAGIFFIQPEHGNQTLTLGCLSVIINCPAKNYSDLRNLDTVSTRAYVYSSKSWVYHCMASYRKLALNGPILEFAHSTLQTWADFADKWSGLDTRSCLRDVLVLSQQNMSPKITEAIVSYGLKTEARKAELPRYMDEWEY
ncbi:hypothetical protein M408DRAFT_334180 [Serendipita vermifera MAFF 305830]|uniref:Nephrocystin 3-like N-terminal domain-containing protein n=1 Tax=Serendipita vermifera MAFF 305830 TaxID=933852 RepID=A0A0C3AIV4_SERVB|nr:hypothetical protein M408DRAFT_334180 [Serendipita vermifera MAFF 305830]